MKSLILISFSSLSSSDCVLERRESPFITVCFITRRVPVFVNYLRKSGFPSFQAGIDGENDFFCFWAVVERNKGRGYNNGYFESIHSKLLFYSPKKFDSFPY